MAAARAKEGLASGHMVPITREFLKKYYENIDAMELDDDIEPLEKQLSETAERLKAVLHEHSITPDVLELSHPHKIDENAMRCRQEMEEISNIIDTTNVGDLLLSKGMKDEGEHGMSWCTSTLAQASKDAADAGDQTVNWQRMNVERVMGIISLFLPKDGFRASIARQISERGDRKKKAEVEELIKSGCTIREKFDLLWRQQLDRRAMLIRIGDASGPFRFILRYLAGIPQVLLDFAKQINDDEGPLEEQRIKYAPTIYHLFEFGNNLHVLVDLFMKALAWIDIDVIVDSVELIRRGMELFCKEIHRFLYFMTFLFEESPFFITEEEAAAMTSQSKGLPYTEIVVPARRTVEASITVEKPGSRIAWHFSTIENDIGYRLVYRPLLRKHTRSDAALMSEEPKVLDQRPASESTFTDYVILSSSRVNSHIDAVDGEHVAEDRGKYVLIFDNTYSYIKSKTVHYTFIMLDPST